MHPGWDHRLEWKPVRSLEHERLGLGQLSGFALARRPWVAATIPNSPDKMGIWAPDGRG